MAALTGSTIASTYTGLLKTSDSGARGAEGSADQCSDGAGNTIPLFVSATEVYAIGSGTGTSHTAFGKDCGVDLAAGTGNSLFGEGAGADVTTGEHNVAVGYHALYQGTTETDDNVAIGYNAMSGSWTTAAVNDCVVIGSGAGAGALVADASGTIAIGYAAGAAMTDPADAGEVSTFIGYQAGKANTIGSGQVAVGYEALLTNVAGGRNTAIGFQALKVATKASAADVYNVAVGYKAGVALTSGTKNIFVGGRAGIGTEAVGSTVIVGTEAAEGVMTSDANGTVAVGYRALKALTSGAGNVAVGFEAGMALTTQNYNTFIGHESGEANTGTSNVGVGYRSLADATSDVDSCVAIGYNAMATADSAYDDGCTAVGYKALQDQNGTGATGNTAVGFESSKVLTTGAENVSVGYQALTALTTGGANVAIGFKAADAMAVGESHNIAIGSNAMESIDEGTAGGDADHNIAIGTSALAGGDFAGNDRQFQANIAIGSNSLNSTGTNASTGQIAIGYDALTALTSGTENTAIGYQAGKAMTTGGNLTAVGYNAAPALPAGANANTAIGGNALLLGDNGSTDHNTCVGYQAGDVITTGHTNTIIGSGSDPSAAGGTNQTVVGYGATGQANDSVTLGNASVTAVYMAQDSGATVHAGGALFGLDTANTSGGGSNQMVQIESVGDSAGMTVACTATSTSSGSIEFVKARGAAIGSDTAAAEDDLLGQIKFAGADGSDRHTNAASIVAAVDGSVGSSVMPGRLVFNTTVDGGGSVTERMRIDQAGNILINESSNANMLLGMTLNQGGYDNEILAFKSSDVAHGMTDIAETDTYGTFKKGGADSGALMISGFGESTLGVIIAGNAVSPQTDKNTGANSPCNVNSHLKSSATVGAMSADGNLFCVQNNGSTRFLVDEDGDIYYDGSAAAYDNYDDAQLVRAMDTTMSPKEIIQSRFDDYIKYNEKTLVEADLMGDVSDDRKAKGVKPLISLTGMQRLHNGAIWQQYTEMQKMKELMYDTMVELIGKEKADAKLKDHDIKLLDENTLLN